MKLNVIIASAAVAATVALGLGACGSAHTAAPAANTKPATAHSAPAPVRAPPVDYKAQYEADVTPANTAGSRIDHATATITSPSVIAFGKACKELAGVLVSQTWPANAQADIHALALDAGKVNADIVNQDNAGMYTDVSALSAHINLVRAELGLPATR